MEQFYVSAAILIFTLGVLIARSLIYPWFTVGALFSSDMIYDRITLDLHVEYNHVCSSLRHVELSKTNPILSHIRVFGLSADTPRLNYLELSI